MSSSISNSKKWQKYWKYLVFSALGLLTFLYLSIIIVDPFDNFAISPNFDRAPMATNQRFSYPALARNKDFDSAIIGTSSIRVFKPSSLNESLGGNFVNLGLNAARPYEQYRFLKLFLEHHKSPKSIILGLDIKNKDVWCRKDELVKFTSREFPEWMFDDNPYNDFFHVFNAKSLEIVGRQIGQLLGFVEPRYSREGYARFTPVMEDHYLPETQRKIYGAKGVRQKPPFPVYPEVSTDVVRNYIFPALEYFEKGLNMIPEETVKIILLPPRHWFAQPHPNTKKGQVLSECKRRIVKLAGRLKNAHVFDFAIESSITTDDANYWDEIHFTDNVAEEIIDSISSKVTESSDAKETYIYN